MAHSGVERDWRKRSRSLCRWDRLWGLALCLSIFAYGEGWPAEPWGVHPSARPCGEEARLGAPVAEVTFAAPRKFVIIGDQKYTERLYEAGVSISGAHDAGAGVKILRIEHRRIQVRDHRTETALWLSPGDRVPGTPDRFVAGTTLLSSLSYHYRVAERPPDSEPKLLCIGATRALLEVTVPVRWEAGPTPADGKMTVPQQGEAATSVGHPLKQHPGEAAQVVEVAPHTYELGAKDLQDLLDQGERLVSEAWAGGWLLAPRLTQAPQDIESPVADGTLGPRGFRVASPKLAEAFGLEAGDVILAVDGRAVKTFDDLYHVYQQVRRVARRPRFEVTLERDGVQVTKTYLIK